MLDDTGLIGESESLAGLSPPAPPRNSARTVNVPSSGPIISDYLRFDLNFIEICEFYGPHTLKAILRVRDTVMFGSRSFSLSKNSF
jgi:hypothetical protein